MTATEPIDCQAAASRLYEYLDGELTPEAEASIRTHLEECAPCFSLFGFEGAYLAFLKARTKARTVPEYLKKHIFEQVLFDRDSVETE
jgi:anti-sigma factor (TIGR02949 family)